MHKLTEKELQTKKNADFFYQLDEKWSNHINALSKKISSGIGSIKRISHCVPPGTLQNIYYGLVKSHFDYCSVVWGNCAKTLSDKLQKLQNRAVRVLTHSSYDADANQLLTELGWDNLETRRKKLKAEMVFKAIICPQNSFRGVMWLLLTICAILKISLLFPYHVITIMKIALAIVVQSSGPAYPQLLGKQHLWLISDDC